MRHTHSHNAQHEGLNYSHTDMETKNSELWRDESLGEGERKKRKFQVKKGCLWQKRKTKNKRAFTQSTTGDFFLFVSGPRARDRGSQQSTMGRQAPQTRATRSLSFRIEKENKTKKLARPKVHGRGATLRSVLFVSVSSIRGPQREVVTEELHDQSRVLVRLLVQGV